MHWDFAFFIQTFIFDPILLCSAIVLTLATAFSIVVQSNGSPPSLFYKESDFSRLLLQKIPRLRDPYCPPRWAINSCLQTLLFYYLLPQEKVRFDRQYLQLKDRGIVALDWALPTDMTVTRAVWAGMRRNSPILLLIPDYITDALCHGSVCSDAMRRGFRPVVFNRRGHGGTFLTTPRLQSYGDPSDLRQVIKFIRCFSPNSRLTALGYGAGGDLLLAYLGEFGSSAYITACTAVSPIYDPEQLFHDKNGLNRAYDLLWRLECRRLVSKHAGVLNKSVDVAAAIRSGSLGEMEVLLYGKMTGTEDSEQYWEKNAPLRDADDISTPLLCISSGDDPFKASQDTIPYEIFRLYPNLFLVVTEHGGHCAFMEYNNEWQVKSWADRLALDFLQVTLDFVAHEERRTKSASR